MGNAQINTPINILLADDDADEQHFFETAVKELPFEITLKTVKNGAQLMDYLSNNCGSLPDVIFLDIIMPRKNGLECLLEIKHNEFFKRIPVIMYSNSVGDEYIRKSYKGGAFNFFRKGIYVELTESINKLLINLSGSADQPSEDKFVFSL